MNLSLPITPPKPSAVSSNELAKRFRMLLDWYSAAASSHDVPIRGYNGEAPAFFLSLPEEMQFEIYHNFARYTDVCAETIRDGYSLTDEKALLWRFFKKMQFRQTSDLFSMFEDGDVIEIYDLTGFVQMFRNLRFFSVCSYSLDDILCRPYWELYKRDEIISAKIIEAATRLANQEVRAAIHYDTTKYIVEEIDSPKLFQCQVENRFTAPLFDHQGNTVAAVHVMRCHEIHIPVQRSLNESEKTS